MTAGPDQNLWLATSESIMRMTTSGVVTSFPTPSAFKLQIIQGPDGNLWWYENYDLGRITPDGVVTRFDVNGPIGIAPGPDGNVWYTVRSGQLNRITSSGQLWGNQVTRTLAEIVWAQGGFWGTTVGGVGFVAWADAQPSSGTAPVTLVPTSFAQYLAAGPDGSVWYTGTTLGRIGPSGTQQEFETGGMLLSRPAVAPDGSAWIVFQSVYGDSRLARVTPAGDVTACILSTPGGGIVLGPDQRMWFTEDSIGRIAAFTP